MSSHTDAARSDPGPGRDDAGATHGSTGPVRQMPALDGVRGVAVAMVLAYHLFLGGLVPTVRWLGGGFLGVDVFFVLSGFLIATHLLAEQDRSGTVDVRRFYVRRAWRLLPALAAFAVVYVAYQLLVGATVRNTLWTVASYVTFLPNVVADAVEHTPTDGIHHLWSLAVEVHFYVIVPFLVLLGVGRRRPVWVVAAVLVAGIAAPALWRSHLVDDGLSLFDVYPRSSARLDALVVGVAAAVVDRRLALPTRALGVAGWIALGGVLLALAEASPLDLWLYRGGYTAFAGVVAVVVLAAAHGTGPGAVLRWRPLRELGKVSYALYVWHLVVFAAVARWVDGPWPLRTAVALGVTGAFAVASWHLVERPAMRRGAEGARREKPDPPP